MSRVVIVLLVLARIAVAVIPPPPDPPPSFTMAVQWAATLDGEWKTVLNLPPMGAPGEAGFYRLVKQQTNP